MDADERSIYYYLKSRRPKAVQPREIGRHAASKRRFLYAPDWAMPVLSRMAERNILEVDETGAFRLKPIPPRQTDGKRWASPQFIEILKAKGKAVTDLLVPEDEDAYYDAL
jgi:hypothetical protein